MAVNTYITIIFFYVAAIATMLLVDMLNQLYNNVVAAAVMLIILVVTVTAVLSRDDHLKAEHYRVHCDEFKNRLADLDLYILDNSIRESTVGQPLCHTLQDKINIYKEIKKVGIKDMMVASFSHHHQVDDDFIQYLRDIKEDFSNFFAFSEIATGINDGTYDSSKIPTQLQKIQKYGILNPFFEVDLASKKIDWDNKFTVDDICQILYKLIMWTYNNISSTSRIAVNFRDYGIVMKEAPERFFGVLKFLSRLPAHHRPWCLAIEDATGDALHVELASWIQTTRSVMTKNGWKSGKLIVHIHQKFDLSTASQLECLAAGADGIWAGLSDDGATIGHASSSVTILNLLRLNNTKVIQKYNIKQLKKSATTITRITTGKDPPCNQVLFGENAGDLIFEDFGVGEFDIPHVFNESCSIRLSASVATPNLVLSQLKKYFGDNPQFTSTTLAEEMIRLMHEDLRSQVKKNYNNKKELAELFIRAGGSYNMNSKLISSP